MVAYRDLLASGWRMSDIDDMDFVGWMQVRSYAARKADPRTKPGHIDDLAFFACGVS